jgi:hypothetical protein
VSEGSEVAHDEPVATAEEEDSVNGAEEDDESRGEDEYIRRLGTNLDRSLTI